MALLGSIKDIIIGTNIIFENINLDGEIDINDFKIKKVEMVSNYKMKLLLKNKDGINGCLYISAVNDSSQGRNILIKLLLSPKIIDIPLGVLFKLDINYFESYD